MAQNANAEQIAYRTRELESKTTLSSREAEVVARKEAEQSHSRIADELGIEKGTVDSHAHRARVKYNMAVTTVEQLERFYEQEVVEYTNGYPEGRDAERFEPGDQVETVDGTFSIDPDTYTRTGHVGEVVEVENNPDGPRRVLVDLETTGENWMSESRLVSAESG